MLHDVIFAQSFMGWSIVCNYSQLKNAGIFTQVVHKRENPRVMSSECTTQMTAWEDLSAAFKADVCGDHIPLPLLIYGSFGSRFLCTHELSFS
jgi:hypothetical protein